MMPPRPDSPIIRFLPIMPVYTLMAQAVKLPLRAGEVEFLFPELSDDPNKTKPPSCTGHEGGSFRSPNESGDPRLSRSAQPPTLKFTTRLLPCCPSDATLRLM